MSRPTMDELRKKASGAGSAANPAATPSLRAVEVPGKQGRFEMTGDAERAARVTLIEELRDSIRAAGAISGNDDVVALPMTHGARKVIVEALEIYWLALFRMTQEDAGEPTTEPQARSESPSPAGASERRPSSPGTENG